MEEEIGITYSVAKKIFDSWKKEFDEFPEQFTDIAVADSGYAHECAKHFMKLAKEIKV